MDFFFLPEDIERFDGHIASVEEHIRAVGRDMGAACNESAETWHDNFAYEDGTRQLTMWTKRLMELRSIRERCRVARPCGPPEVVRIGRGVRLRDLATGKERIVRIGSYLVLSGDPSISYASPLARLLLGVQEGALVEGIIGGAEVQIEVLEVLAGEAALESIREGRRLRAGCAEASQVLGQ